MAVTTTVAAVVPAAPVGGVNADAWAELAPALGWVAPTRVTRWRWAVSSWGRLRLRLLAALAALGTPAEEPAVASLQYELERLLPVQPRGRPVVETIRLVRYFLVWYALQNRCPAAAVTELRHLDEDGPDGPAWRLRLPLLPQLLAGGDLAAYQEQAARLLAAPAITLARHREPIQQLIAVLFTKVSPAACELVLKAAHEALRAEPLVRATILLATRPAEFRSAQEATACANQCPPVTFQFAPALQYEALLVRMTAAAWNRDAAAMLRLAGQLHSLRPTDLRTCYWLLRARLCARQPKPTAGFKPTAWPATPEWWRLRRLVRLRLNPGLNQAEAALPVLTPPDGPLSEPERDLALALLEEALPVSPRWPPAELGRAAAIARELARTGTVPAWVQRCLALHELLVTRDAAAASQRLALWRGRSDEVGRLARLAQLVAGAPDLTDLQKEDPVLEAGKSVAHWLLGPHVDAPLDVARYERRLAEAVASPLARDFPVLGTVLTGLRLALLATTRGAAARAEVAAWQPPALAPPWLVWLHARCRLLVSPTTDPQVLAALPREQPAVAWAVGSWVCHYGAGPLWPPPAAVPKGWPPELTTLAAQVADWRRGNFHNVPAGAVRASNLVAFPELGPVPGLACVRELEFEHAYALARRLLLNHDPDAALRQFTELGHRLDGEGALLRAWWRPVVRYWEGVALAHLGDPAAPAVLTEVAAGLKGPEARAQLALLAWQRNDVPEAARWLADTPPVFPSVAYARALLAVRRGHVLEARSLLANYPQLLGGRPTPYPMAFRRLLAALDERLGRREQAAQRHLAILRDAPGDVLTGARLARLRLRTWYEDGGAPEGLAVIEQWLAVAAAGPRPLPWAAPCHRCCRLLAAPTAELPAWRDELRRITAPTDVELAWRQLLARRFLSEGRPEEAWSLVGRLPASPGLPWLTHTVRVLQAWRLLRRLWSPGAFGDQTVSARERTTGIAANVGAELARYVAAIKPISRHVTPELVRQWQDLATQALRLSLATRDQAGVTAEWQLFWRDRLLRILPRLAVADQQERQQAGQELTRAVEDRPLTWDVGLDHALIEALLRWTMKHSGPGAGPLLIERWRTMIENAVHDAQGARHPVRAGEGFWATMAAGPGAAVARLWAPAEDTRLAAAQLVGATENDGPGAPPEQVLLAAAAAWIRGDNERFLRCFERLSAGGDDLPVVAADLRLAAASIWANRRCWPQVVATQPGGLDAAPADPRLRLFLGVAAAHLAWEAAAGGDVTPALAQAARARDLLTPLLAVAEGTTTHG